MSSYVDQLFGRARMAYVRALERAQSQRARLPRDSLEALTAEMVTLLSTRLGHLSPSAEQPTDSAVQEFVDVLLSERPQDASIQINQARAAGMSRDTIYLGYLTQAARELGERWEQDRVDFARVTIATGHIYALLRALRSTAPATEDPDRRALFMTLPGDDHSLGIAIAADLFRNHGWHIEVLKPANQAQAVEAMGQTTHAIVGISSSQADQLGELARLVQALHIHRPGLYIMVGGPITASVPDLAELVDADALATSADEAVQRLEDRLAYQRRQATDPSST